MLGLLTTLVGNLTVNEAQIVFLNQTKQETTQKEHIVTGALLEGFLSAIGLVGSTHFSHNLGDNLKGDIVSSLTLTTLLSAASAQAPSESIGLQIDPKYKIFVALGLLAIKMQESDGKEPLPLLAKTAKELLILQAISKVAVHCINTFPLFLKNLYAKNMGL